MAAFSGPSFNLSGGGILWRVLLGRWPERSPAAERWPRYQTRYRLYQGPLPLIALLNVILLIFLFIIWGSRIVLQPGLLVQLPVAAFAAGAPYGQAVVTVTRVGQIFFNDERIALDSLGLALSQAIELNEDLTLTIEADKDVSYETVIRAMNIAAALGCKQINLAVHPSFGEEIVP